MKELCLFLKCGKVFRKADATLENFQTIKEAMADTECGAIVFEEEAWVRKDEIVSIILKDAEVYKNSDLPQ